MSEEQLRAFISKVQADASLQQQLKAEGADPVAIAKTAGFAITIEDLNDYRQNLANSWQVAMVQGVLRRNGWWKRFAPK